MLMEFFLEQARIELSRDGAHFVGTVPDLPEIRVEADSAEQCHLRLAEAIADLLADEGGRMQLPVNERESAPPRSDGYEEIIYDKRDWVARVTINRPDVYNAYSSTTLIEMAEAFRDAAADDQVAVLVLTGAADRAFCTGSDIKEHVEEHQGKPQALWKWLGLLLEAHDALRHLGKPAIARINGIVAAGGNEWNLACDLAVAADHAKFLQIETSVGTVAACSGAQWLPLVIGDRRAREMLLVGEPVSAHKALLWGLVNDVVPYDELDATVEELCSKLIARFPQSTRYTRQQLSFWKDLAWDATIRQARDYLSLHLSGDEAAEGMKALAERVEIDYRAFRSRVFRAATGPEPKAGRNCDNCGARGLPEQFDFCGICGTKLG